MWQVCKSLVGRPLLHTTKATKEHGRLLDYNIYENQPVFTKAEKTGFVGSLKTIGLI
jgi:hypothetical protein